MHLSLSNGESLTVYGNRDSENLRIIFYMKAMKYLHKKYYAFLAHIVDKRDKKKEIKEEP